MAPVSKVFHSLHLWAVAFGTRTQPRWQLPASGLCHSLPPGGPKCASCRDRNRARVSEPTCRLAAHFQPAGLPCMYLYDIGNLVIKLYVSWHSLTQTEYPPPLLAAETELKHHRQLAIFQHSFDESQQDLFIMCYCQLLNSIKLDSAHSLLKKKWCRHNLKRSCWFQTWHFIGDLTLATCLLITAFLP